MTDLFISYTHRDNARLSDEQHGWVDRFHEALEMRLASLWGRPAEIWRDPKTRGNDVLDAAIESSVVHSSILVTVLSPAYLHSQWCAKELELFCEAAARGAGLHVGTRSRLVKVIKTPVNVDAALDALAESIGYPFFRLDERGLPWEFDVRLGDRAREQFLAKVNEVAYDICSMLEQLTGASGDRLRPASGLTVYLAETTSDMAAACDQVRRELEQHGHAILPNRTHHYGAGYGVNVASDLAGAALAIHPIGDSYGIVPEASSESILEIQYDLAGAQVQTRPDFIRIPWMLPGNAPSDARLARFIARLQDDERFLITSVDNVKAIAAEHLASRSGRPAVPAASQRHANSVYLIADRSDVESAKACEDALFEEGLEVIRPLYEGSEAELRLDHEESLTGCDAVLIYFGSATEFWLRTKLRDVQKAFGYGRTSPFAAAAVLLATPDRPEKRRFRSNELLVLDALAGFERTALAPFVERVRAARNRAS